MKLSCGQLSTTGSSGSSGKTSSSSDPALSCAPVIWQKAAPAIRAQRGVFHLAQKPVQSVRRTKCCRGDEAPAFGLRLRHQPRNGRRGCRGHSGSAAEVQPSSGRWRGVSPAPTRLQGSWVQPDGRPARPPPRRPRTAGLHHRFPGSRGPVRGPDRRGQVRPRAASRVLRRGRHGATTAVADGLSDQPAVCRRHQGQSMRPSGRCL